MLGKEAKTSHQRRAMQVQFLCDVNQHIYTRKLLDIYYLFMVQAQDRFTYKYFAFPTSGKGPQIFLFFCRQASRLLGLKKHT